MVGAMRDAIFPGEQIERCTLLAEQAASPEEREYWLRSARLWEAILEVKTVKRHSASTQRVAIGQQ
jgi:hypothetical protein